MRFFIKISLACTGYSLRYGLEIDCVHDQRNEAIAILRPRLVKGGGRQINRLIEHMDRTTRAPTTPVMTKNGTFASKFVQSHKNGDKWGGFQQDRT